MDKLLAVFLKGCNCVEGELLVRIDFVSRTWNDPRGDSFICFDKIFVALVGDGDEVGLEVFGVLDDEGGGNNIGKRLIGEVSARQNVNGLNS